MSSIFKTFLSNHKRLFIALGIGSLSLLSFGFYKLYKYYQNFPIPSLGIDLNTIYDKNGEITEEGFAILTLKIKEVAENYFQEKSPLLKIQMRNSLNQLEEYNELFRQAVILSEESENFAMDFVLRSLPKQISIEQFTIKQQTISPEILQKHFIKSFQPTENEDKIDTNTLKEAKLFVLDLSMKFRISLMNLMMTHQNSNELELKQLMLFSERFNQTRLNDMLFVKYGLELDRLEILCVIKGINDDPEIKAKIEEFKEQ